MKMTTTHDALQEFLLDQQARLNSDKTVRDYHDKLILWIKFAGHDTDISTVTRHDMRLYITSIRGRDLSRESIRSYIRSLRVFWKFASSEYGIRNAMETIKEPRSKHRKPQGIKEADFIKLFNAIDDTETGIRDRAILCLFADTGARLGGIVSLQVDTIDTIRRYGIATEKGFQQRTLYWTHYTNQLIDKWITVRPPTESKSLFVSMQEGREHTGLTKSGVYQVLKRLKAKSGVDGKCNPHSFRHNFARQYLLSGGDVVTLAKILGHKDVNMTAEYYAIFDDKELSQLQDEHSPLLIMLGLR